MRELKPEEVETVFGKLAKYIGKNVEKLIDRNDGKYVFRVLKDRVYYMSQQLEKMASNIPESSSLALACLSENSHTIRSFTLRSRHFPY